MRRIFVALALALTLTTPAPAQDWPSRPMTMVVAYAAGGPVALRIERDMDVAADAAELRLMKRPDVAVRLDGTPGARARVDRPPGVARQRGGQEKLGRGLVSALSLS